MIKQFFRSFRLRTNFKCDIFLQNHFNTTSTRPVQEPIISGLTFYRFQKIMDVPDGVFKGMKDRFNGVTIDSNQEYKNGDNFLNKLEKSLNFWKENKYRCIWFKVYTQNAEWVPDLAKRGFNFHHVKDGYVMMFKWLPNDETENIPSYSHTMVGVGGIVVNDKHQVLAVSDRFGMIPGSWKLPGGYVDPGENLIDAAIREVEEETGIKSEFDTLISMRHSHGGNFGCSDIYVVFALKPITDTLRRCEREIAKLEWIPIKEFLEHPMVHETNRQFVKTYETYKKYGIKINYEERIHQVLKKKYTLYTADLNLESGN